MTCRCASPQDSSITAPSAGLARYWTAPLHAAAHTRWTCTGTSRHFHISHDHDRDTARNQDHYRRIDHTDSFSLLTASMTHWAVGRVAISVADVTRPAAVSAVAHFSPLPPQSGHGTV